MKLLAKLRGLLNFGKLRGLLNLDEPRSHMVIMATVFYAIGLTLLWQPGRYYNTPSYANLLAFPYSPYVWGGIYVLTSSIQVLCILRYSSRSLVIFAHTLAITLVLVWLGAFIVRYFTDSGTTIVNVASWSVYLYLTSRSALMWDDCTNARE